MRRLYLLMAIAGFIITYGLGVIFVIKYGWDVKLFWDWSLGNLAGASVVADATLSIFVFWAFVWHESYRLGMPHRWAYIAATFALGLIAPLGFFLYKREDYLPQPTEQPAA